MNSIMRKGGDRRTHSVSLADVLNMSNPNPT
jgi:hypothetical protein